MRNTSSDFLRQARDRADGLLRDLGDGVPASAPAVMLPAAGVADPACGISCTWTGTFGTYTNTF